MPPSNGALTRKPLPMMDASGVSRAFQADDLESRGEKIRNRLTHRTTRMMIVFKITMLFWGKVEGRSRLQFGVRFNDFCFVL